VFVKFCATGLETGYCFLTVASTANLTGRHSRSNNRSAGTGDAGLSASGKHELQTCFSPRKSAREARS
jgi:hypothetical protein